DLRSVRTACGSTPANRTTMGRDSGSGSKPRSNSLPPILGMTESGGIEGGRRKAKDSPRLPPLRLLNSVLALWPRRLAGSGLPEQRDFHYPHDGTSWTEDTKP